MTNAEPLSRLDRIEQILARTAEQQQINTDAISANTVAIGELSRELQLRISHLVGVIGDFAESAQSAKRLIPS